MWAIAPFVNKLSFPIDLLFSKEDKMESVMEEVGFQELQEYGGEGL